MSKAAHNHKQCLDLFARMSEYLDGELDESLCRSMEGHLSGCPACRVCLAELRRTVQLHHASGNVVAIPESMAARLKELCEQFNKQ
ncbi:MAG: zf-HC2 domain-containing protein [Desulfobacteraceae bacterium]|nr:zf-HC2 domain-containing protein [Desulfobacteraceae bacterium]